MTTTSVIHRCRCKGPLKVIDVSGFSKTACCKACRFCSLIIEHPDISACIHLVDFHLKRGDGPHQRPTYDMQMATKLVRCLKYGWPISPATLVDFGIDTVDHAAALAHSVHIGVTAYDLDRVIGDGPAITQLVRSVPDQPCPNVEFRTAYDGRDWCEGHEDF